MERQRAWPLVFTGRIDVRRLGFSARVIIRSRILAEESESDIWLDGAQPGSFATSCPNLASAPEALATLLRDILSALADGVNDFSSFKASVHEFFGEVDEPVNAIWMGLWQASREGRLDSGPVDHLDRVQGDATSATVEVKELTPVLVSSSDEPQHTNTEPQKPFELQELQEPQLAKAA